MRKKRKGKIAREVLLINPNYLKVYKYVSEEATMVEPPLGLAYIAAFLRENNISVSILDAAALNLEYEDIEKYIERMNPEIIGISATTNTIEEAYKIAKITKKINNKILVIVGGPHTSILPKKTLEECKNIDITVKGEGEEVMLEIVKNHPLNKIKGITYRKKISKKEKIIQNKDRELIKNLDKLPFPARDMLPQKKYYSVGIREYPFTTLVTSRGCPYNCNFCVNYAVLGRGFRARSAENVLAEIDMLVQKYGIREIDFIDDNFTLDPERAEKICDMLIERKYKLIWKLGNGIRADKVNEKLIRKMKQSGCYLIAFGVETGNAEIMKNINKGETLEDIEKAIKLCKKYGIITEGFFIIGNLGDSEKTIQETINFAKKLDLDIAQFQTFIPIPGSEYAKIIEKEGKIFTKSWKDYNAFGKPIFSHNTLTPKLMEKMQKKAWKEYYFRPRMILKKIGEIKNPKQFLAYLKGALALIKF